MSSARESQGHHGLKRAASPDVNGRGARGGAGRRPAGREGGRGEAPVRDAGKAAAFPGRPLPPPSSP